MTRLETFADLSREFAQPGNTWRILPLLRFNDDWDPEQLRWQVRSLKAQGCGGLFTYCEVMDGGAPFKFLTEEWWRVVECLAAACAEEGLEYWVYDEEDWPTGSAGGALLARQPELTWRYLHAEEHAAPPDESLSINIPSAISSEDQTLFVAALAYRKTGEKTIDRDSIVDLTPEVREGQLHWRAPGAGWTLAVYTARPGKGFYLDTYPDLMRREMGEAYTEMVYEAHRQRVAPIPGAPIQGFFTDEPAMSLAMVPWAMASDNETGTWYPSISWTPELPAMYEELFGEAWRPRLPLLYHDAAPESLRVRCRHWATCNHLFRRNFLGRLYRFCDEHNMAYSGHLMGEEAFMWHLSFYGGGMAECYRDMHIPGIDWIMPLDALMPSTTPKYACSAAHRDGRERTWCESFAGSGWGLTFQEMRRITGWEHVNGINMQIPICYKHSLRGRRRAQFYNPGISYQQPYWDHFRVFADCEARLCVLSAAGRHVAQVALAYPGVDIQAHGWEHDLLNQRSEEYNRIGDQLRAAGYDYDILDDQTLTGETKLEGGQLVTATERFDALVLPRMDAVRRAIVARALEFARSGGTVLFVGALPRHSFEAGADDPALATLLHIPFGEPAASGQPPHRGWRPIGPGWIGFAPATEDVPTMLAEFHRPDLTLPAGTEEIFSCHQRLADAELYLLLNRANETRTVEVSLGAIGRPTRLDPVTGKMSELESYEAMPESTRLPLTFMPYESVAVVLRPEPDEINPSLAAHHQTERLLHEISLPGPFRFELEETLKRPELAWNFTPGDDAWLSDQPPITAPAELPLGDWCSHGLEFFSGLGHYHTTFDLPPLPPAARVILALGRVSLSAEVNVNAKSAGITCFEPYELDITACCQPGRNAIKITVANTLANFYSRYEELRTEPRWHGGADPATRESGLLGPVTVRVLSRVEED